MAAVDDRDRRRDLRQQLGKLRAAPRGTCGRSASTRRSGRRRSRRGSPRGSRRGPRPRSCRAPRRRSRAGPSGGTCRGRGRAPTTGAAHRARAAPPLRRCRRSRPRTARGCAAAANSAAEVPTSGATMCGVPEIGLGDELGQEPAHRARRQEIVSALGGAEPGQVDGEQAGVLGERRPHRRERVQALRPRARQQQRPAPAGRRCRRSGSSRPSIVRNCGLIDAVSEVFMTTPSESRRPAHVGSSVPACSATM